MNEFLSPQTGAETETKPLDGLQHTFDTDDEAREAGFTIPAAFGNQLLRPHQSGKSDIDIAIDRYGVDNLASVRRGTSNLYGIYAKPLEVAPAKRSGIRRLLGRSAAH